MTSEEAWDRSETPDGQATYVVQQRERMPDSEDGLERWADVARQHFPLKTQTKTVLLAVIGLLGLEPVEVDAFRVLDADNARLRRLRPKPRDTPEYEIV